MNSSFLPKLLSSFADFTEPRPPIDHGALCQRLIALELARASHSNDLFKQLASGLIRIAEHYIGLRDMRLLAEVSEILLNLPQPEANTAGTYYHAVVTKRRGQAGYAQTLLEQIADSPTANYRARAMQTLGVMHHECGDLNEAGRFYIEALRARGEHDPITALSAGETISAIKSASGDHKGALADLQDLWPLFQLVARQHPFYFYVYHNALAVEFGELGHIAEAEASCAIAVASPFAHVYPEYFETRDEIAAKRFTARPSVVANTRPSEAHRSPKAEPERKPKRLVKLVFSFSTRKATVIQRALRIATSAAILLNYAITPTILDRVLICIGSRAPPRC